VPSDVPIYPLSMDEEPKLRRAYLRGYRRGDVELALARATIARERLQVELDATKARVEALQSEVESLRAQIDVHRKRETDLLAALDEVRARRETLEREARQRADEVLGEAVHRAAQLRTEGLRQVGELQQQVEQLLALRAGLGSTLRRALEEAEATLENLTAAPARAVERVPDEQRRVAPTQPAVRTADSLEDTLRPLSADTDR
jgi:chromosome segregation ATPase